MDYLSQLQTLKEDKGLTSADIAKLSGVPEQTVKRIFNGTTPDPRFDTIAKITISLGGSLDIISGLRPETDFKPSTPVRKALSASADLIGEKDIRIAELKEELKRERRAKTIILCVAAAFSVLFVSLLTFLIFDILNGNVGFIRY
jgi:transcriptional regulator with XRE-family HTH domain